MALPFVDKVRDRLKCNIEIEDIYKEEQHKIIQKVKDYSYKKRLEKFGFTTLLE